MFMLVLKAEFLGEISIEVIHSFESFEILY